MRRLLIPLFALASTACAASPAVLPNAPEGQPPKVAEPAGPDPFAVDGPLREEWLPLLKAPAVDPKKATLPSAPSGLAEVPECKPYAERKASGGAPACGDKASALAALDTAMRVQGDDARDQALANLEGCAGLPAGSVRGLRAELAPSRACAEGIVGPILKSPPANMTGLVHHALLGEAVASRLARTARRPPTLDKPYTKPRVLEFIKGPMRSWFEAQARLIEDVSVSASELPYYGKAIAAVEAGLADLRLVDAARSAPVPDEFDKDAELKTAYYGSLDQWLEPRKARGRDAALVGLKEMALVGVLHDGRVHDARELLSKLYGGRRIDALDRLLLPPVAWPQASSPEEHLAETLPTFYAGVLLDENAAAHDKTLRVFFKKGLPLPQRMALRQATLPADARAAYARGRLDIGRTYWTAVDVDQAIALSASARKEAESPEVTLTLAVALALRGGPDDAADMMRKGRGRGEPHTAALDAIKTGPYAGMAAYDAATIRMLQAPEGAPASYFADLAARFKAAEGLLTDPAHKKLAADHASEAEGFAKFAAAPAGK